MGHVAHFDVLLVLHLILPKTALGMTGVPISSKQALLEPSGGGIHSEVFFTSSSFYKISKLFFQYCIGEVTKQPLPDIGLKQKSFRV